MVIVIVLPFAQLLVEEVDVVADAILVEELVELLVIDAMGALDLASEVRRSRPNVHVADIEGLEMPLKLGLKLRAVVPSEKEVMTRQALL
jgi:hypothetical protein